MYSTCSILKSENSERIADFLQRCPTAREVPLVKNAAACDHGLQLFPQAQGHDGFFYALLQKW